MINSIYHIVWGDLTPRCDSIGGMLISGGIGVLVDRSQEWMSKDKKVI